MNKESKELAKKILNKIHLLDLGYYFQESRNKRMKEKDYEKNLKKWYKTTLKKDLDLENPRSFNEKIQWLKLYDSTPLKTKLADKYLVREWIKEKIGDEYLIPFLGVWDNANDIDFNSLPNEFILKINNGTSRNIIVKDKNKINEKEIKKTLNRWLSYNLGYKDGMELHYRKIQPKIIAEELLEEEGQEGLIDYRIFCFSGETKFIMADVPDKKAEGNCRLNIYNTDWKSLPFSINRPNTAEVKRPKNLELMIRIANELSKEFSHARIDLYNINQKIYFGEITFTHNAGGSKVSPEEWDYTIGSWLTLPKEKSPIPH